MSDVLGALEGPRSSLFRAMYKTHAEISPGLYLFPVAFRPYNDVDSIGNIMLVASAERGLTRNEIMDKARRVASRVTFREFLKYAADYYGESAPAEDVPVLTDDYAPVDTLVPLYQWTPATRP